MLMHGKNIFSATFFCIKELETASFHIFSTDLDIINLKQENIATVRI